MSQHQRSTRASADSDHICLTVSTGTFLSRRLSGLFYTERLSYLGSIIYVQDLLSHNEASSGFKIHAYICIIAGWRVKYAWLIIRCEGLCRVFVFVPEVALKS